MSKLKFKGIFFLKLYITIIVFLVSFFSIFAFRYDVLDHFIKQGYITNEVDQEVISSIQSKVINIDAKNDNIEIIGKIIKEEINDYAFQVANYGDYINEDARVIGDNFIYYYYQKGQTPGKYSVTYEISYPLQFKNTPALLFLYPNFTSFLNWYKIITLCLSLIISVLFIVLLYFINKKKWISTINQKIKTKKIYSLVKRLTTKLILINIIAIVFAVSTFMFLYINRYSFFEFIRESEYYAYDYDDAIAELKGTSANLEMNKKNEKTISALLDKYAINNEDFYLYDEKGLYYVGSERIDVGNYFSRDSFYNVHAIYTPFITMHSVPFKDQTGLLVIYSYRLIHLLIPYIVVIFLISFSFYIMILLSFIRKKVFELKRMQEDVFVLANGDWKHEVRFDGNDEIAELGKHLNQMRISFLENMENEKAARNANKELISAMSHDLRTPLTTLNGYLEIVQLEKGNKEKREEYMKRCLDKVEEIRDLSNKMFEYSLVFSATDDNDIQVISVEEICQFLKDHIQYLKVLGFNIQAELITSKQFIDGNLVMFKRVFNNLFSNIQKYADADKEINVSLSIAKNALKLVMFNHKKPLSNFVESNGIGLKSVRKIIEIHKGECYINDNENDFMIIITLPMNGGH